MKGVCRMEAKDEALKSRLSNFWYYNKWKLLIGAGVAAALLVCILQVAARREPDAFVYYAGECYFSETQAAALEQAFVSAMRSDPDGNGEKTVQLISQVILSPDKQATALHTAREEEEDGSYIYAGNPTENEADHYEQMAYGEAVICLLERSYFEKAREQGRLASLREIMGGLPENAIDEYGFLLGDTAAGQYFEICRALPADTVLCCKRPTVQQKAGSDTYENQITVLRDFLRFSIAS